MCKIYYTKLTLIHNSNKVKEKYVNFVNNESIEQTFCENDVSVNSARPSGNIQRWHISRL